MEFSLASMKLLLLALSLLCSTQATTTFDVTVFPATNITLQAGSTFNLTCRVSNTTGVFGMEWTGPSGGAVETTDNLIVTIDLESNDSAASSLVFSGVRTSQAGNYSCKVNFTDGPSGTSEISVKTSTVNVNVPTPLVTLLWNREEPFYEGTTLDLLCIIQFNGIGIDTPSSLQKQLSFNFGNDSRKELRQFESSDNITLRLRIKPLDKTDEGRFTCRASLMPNSTSEFILPSERTEESLTLTVSDLPLPTIEVSQTTLAIIGQRESLSCSVTVIEHLSVQPSILWTNSRGEILTEPEITHTETEYHSVVTFQQLLASQLGLYTCTVCIHIPSAGIYNHTASSSIDIFAQLPPPLMQLTTNPVGYHGANHTLTCSVSIERSLIDIPTHTQFFWSIVQSSSTTFSPLSPGKLFEIHSTESHSVLKLTPTGQPSMASGTYRCDVLISGEHILPLANGAVAVDVAVQEPPMPVVSIRSSRNVSLCSPIASIECSAELAVELVSPLNFSWVSPTNQIIPDDTIRFEGVTMENAGSFTCMACASVSQVNLTNTCGSSSIPISIEAPEAVEHMACHYTDETSLGLTWSHRSSSVLEYVIEVRQYVRRGEFDEATVVTEQLYSPFATTETRHLITGLERGIRYELSVTGVSAAGCGETENITCYSDDDTPEVVPLVIVRRISATEMNVTWIPLDAVQARGFITQYIVYYSKASSTASDFSIKIVAHDQSFVIVDGLEVESNYLVQVVAQGRSGLTSNLEASSPVSSGIYRTQSSAVIGGAIGGTLAVLVLITIILVAGFVYRIKIKRRRVNGERPPTTNGGPLQFQSNYLIPYYADSMEVNPQYEDIDTFQRKPSEYEVACPTPPQPRPWPEDDVEIEVCLGYENTAISQESDTPTASTDGHE